MSTPIPKSFVPDEITKDVIELVRRHCHDHFGCLNNFNLAVERSQALEVLKAFIDERLPSFGRFQDAMIENAKAKVTKAATEAITNALPGMLDAAMPELPNTTGGAVPGGASMPGMPGL